MTDPIARRHLTAVRALVLDILAVGGRLSKAEMVAAWEARRPELTTAHRERLPRMLDETVWRLLNLGWVARDGDTYAITPEGREVLASRRDGREV